MGIPLVLVYIGSGACFQLTQIQKTQLTVRGKLTDVEVDVTAGAVGETPLLQSLD